MHYKQQTLSHSLRPAISSNQMDERRTERGEIGWQNIQKVNVIVRQDWWEET